jgi:D-alanyl-D-alanine carboxypeptidase/D-alanyl-D-alanine-endopeptidase (penicillin-binding protein 4)
MLLTNSPSDNFFAETLLKDLGARFGGRGSTARGAAVVAKVIGKAFNLHPRLDDGSGLSRYDRSNVRQIVLLLREMQSQRAFWNSLAIAGVRGTMIHEMRHTRGVNDCRGKTGTLNDVANLVGYCRAANGDRIAFALMMTGLTDSTAGHQLEDLDAEALANYRG